MNILQFNKLVGNKSKKSPEKMTKNKSDSEADRKHRTSKKSIKKSSEEDLEDYGFSIGRILGEGSYSTVRAASYKGEEIAVKIITREKISHDFASKFLPREIEVMSKIQHENIIKVYKIFNYPKKVYMFMEMLQKGDLLAYVRAKHRLSEDESRRYFIQMVSAMQYLHGLNIAHRDLKCENVMIGDNKVKLIDFGFCRNTVSSSGRRILSETYCGSTAYAAPEVLQGSPYNPMMYDVWSLGCILFIMVAGSMPFDDSNVRKMVQQQLKRKLKFPSTLTLSSELKDLIKNMLEPDVTRRISMERISRSKWVKIEDDKLKHGKRNNAASQAEVPHILKSRISDGKGSSEKKNKKD